MNIVGPNNNIHKCILIQANYSQIQVSVSLFPMGSSAEFAMIGINELDAIKIKHHSVGFQQPHLSITTVPDLLQYSEIRHFCNLSTHLNRMTHIFKQKELNSNNFPRTSLFTTHSFICHPQRFIPAKAEPRLKMYICSLLYRSPSYILTAPVCCRELNPGLLAHIANMRRNS